MQLYGDPDWSVDPADPSVGIFGETIVHEACKVDEPEPASDDVVSVLTRTRGDERITTLVHEVVCPSCKANTRYIETDFEQVEETP